MAIYLGLGSNLGNRHDNLRRALAALGEAGIAVDRVSPVVESPALLPTDAPADWNAPFLNLVAVCREAPGPERLLATLKRIEGDLGRADARHWAPRPIDIDILIYNDVTMSSAQLEIPHPGLVDRAFALTPLAHLSPGLVIPGTNGTAQALNARLSQRMPLWMGILNLTPDSFSDGGRHASWTALEAAIDTMIANGVHYLDFGAESTRPGATSLTADEEWARLEPALTAVTAKLADDPLRPRLSVDTYHAEVAAKAIALGIDAINDVSGLTQTEMIELATSSEAEFIAMHNLGLPADPGRTLATNRDAIDQLEAWLEARLEAWTGAGIDFDRLIFDPGVGFGKNPLQSLEILRGIERFGELPFRLLVGHSRKSFMRGLAGEDSRRDLFTIGASLSLCERGVDILRVHNVGDHAFAYRGWSHVRPLR